MKTTLRIIAVWIVAAAVAFAGYSILQTPGSAVPPPEGAVQSGSENEGGPGAGLGLGEQGMMQGQGLGAQGAAPGSGRGWRSGSGNGEGAGSSHGHGPATSAERWAGLGLALLKFGAAFVVTVLIAGAARKLSAKKRISQKPAAA